MSLDKDNRPLPAPELFLHNRTEVLKRMRALNANGAIVLYGLPEPGRPLCDYEPLFRQDSSFWYLTGVNVPDCACYIDIGTGKFILFYADVPAEMAIWSGPLPTLDQIKAKYGADDVKLVPELPQFVKDQKPQTIHTILCTYKCDAPAVQDQLEDCIADQRQIKHKLELDLMKYSAAINDLAYRAVLNRLQPGLYEYEVEAEMQRIWYGHYCYASPFQTTVCSGEQCAILHYHRKDRKIQDGDLILIDAGGEYEMYCADNTRTFPVNGHYSDDQKLIYTAVLNTQKAVIAAAKPGVKWQDMALLSAKVMAEGLIKAGLLIGTPEELVENGIVAVFYPHGLGHGMGLDVHEINGWKRGDVRPNTPHLSRLRLGRQLEVGFVVTVEPGCYFIPMLYQEALADPSKAKFINKEVCERLQKSVGGVRIEDDILIVEGGNENLSAKIPKEIDEIEAIMAARK